MNDYNRIVHISSKTWLFHHKIPTSNINYKNYKQKTNRGGALLVDGFNPLAKVLSESHRGRVDGWGWGMGAGKGPLMI
ncbi:hypothetical protein L484_004836 [Morus notabilis]|uniref:Uncharacterized protein n=1 Tax=Morus notabilis TaxID=981085 RepID=W9S5Q9_9ROSA|nr:hypothetical protein L484_004836 [Morus notabilis]